MCSCMSHFKWLCSAIFFLETNHHNELAACQSSFHRNWNGPKGIWDEKSTNCSSLSDVFTESKGHSYFRGQSSDHLFTFWNSFLVLLKQKGNTRYFQLQGALVLYGLCTWQKSRNNLYSNSYSSTRSFFNSKNSFIDMWHWFPALLKEKKNKS